MFDFELEKNSIKYICPACGQKRFVRYVKRSTKEHLSFEVGRCDRESNCGFHFTPKMYFVENPSQKKNDNQKQMVRQGLRIKNGLQAHLSPQMSIKTFDFIPTEQLVNTLRNYDKNEFVQFFLNLFPNCIEEIQTTLTKYFVGTTKDGKTVFWQIDRNNRIRTGKIIAYDADTGKRRKDVSPNWIHSELKKLGFLKQDFNLRQCFFGEHLLKKDSNKPICIVEAEKTAIIASICLPEFVWLAIGSKQSLKFDRIKRLGRDRKILLYPDADGFEIWNQTAQTAQKNGFDVTISKLIQINADAKERKSGNDLADYLITVHISHQAEHQFRIKLNFISHQSEHRFAIA